MSNLDVNFGMVRGYLIAKEAPEPIINAIESMTPQRDDMGWGGYREDFEERKKGKMTPEQLKPYEERDTIEKVITQEMKNEVDAMPAKKERKPRKPLSAENKAALIKRLEIAREAKLARLHGAAPASKSEPKPKN